MTKQKLLIECGAAETRAALIIGDQAVRFFFGPARGDETLPGPARAGEIYAGQVRKISKPLKGAFLDIGEQRDGFLVIKSSQKFPVEGERIIATVRRPSIGAKGAHLSLDWKDQLTAYQCGKIELRAANARPPMRLDECADAVLGALQLAELPSLAEIVIDDSQAVQKLNRRLAHLGQDAAVSTADRPFDLYDAEEALSESFERTVAIAGGGRMIVDESEAMTVIDIDAGAMADGATGRLNDKVNLSAAKKLFSALSRRRIGGRIVVDFLPPSDSKARSNLLEALKASRNNLFECRFGKLRADGVFDLSGPRRDLSLLEFTSEPAEKDWLRPGRQLTLERAAKDAIKVLEQRLAIARLSRLRLLVGAALAAYLDTRPQWRERLAARFGVRFQIERSETLEGRRFVIVEN